MPYYVYILLCHDGTFYTGYTKNLQERLRLHKVGKGARYTKSHKLKELAYSEGFECRADAMRRERAVKKLSHKQKQNLIKTSKDVTR